MSETRSVAKHVLVYGAGILLGKLASFIMLPVYTRYLTPADYGVLELLSTTIDLIGIVAGMGLAAGVFKFHADADTPREKDRVISTVALGGGVLTLLTALLGVLASPLLARLVLRDPAGAVYFRLFFAIYLVQSLNGVGFMLLRLQQRSVLFVTLNAAKLVAALSLNIAFVVWLGMGVRGVLYSTLICSGALSLLLTAYTFRQVGFGFSAAVMRRLYRFGSPVVFWGLGSFVLTFSDRYFLNYFGGSAQVGVYSLAYKFGFLMATFASMPVMQAWEPQRFVVARRPDGPALLRDVFFYLSLALGLAGLVITLFVGDVLAVMAAPGFRAAAGVVPLILLAIVFQEWATYCNLGLFMAERTRLYGWSGVIGVVAVTALNLLLIPRYGMWGAAWATLGAYALRFAAVYLFAQRAHPIDFGWGRVLRLAALL
ncbi:MAG TPA: oligosaccharide flippase family protein, partial [Longimicrobium sp.]